MFRGPKDFLEPSKYNIMGGPKKLLGEVVDSFNSVDGKNTSCLFSLCLARSYCNPNYLAGGSCSLCNIHR